MVWYWKTIYHWSQCQVHLFVALIGKKTTMAKTLRKTESCSNCGKELKKDNYCPDCGQQNTTKNVEISMLLRDFVDDFFTLDSRLFKTIVPLLFKPGFLTVEYNSGKRIKYLPPLRMYLVFSVLFFLNTFWLALHTFPFLIQRETGVSEVLYWPFFPSGLQILPCCMLF